MDCSTPGFPVLRYLPEYAQTYVHWVDDTIQSPCPLFLLPSIFPSIRVSSNDSALCIRWPNTGASPSALAFPMNIQGWFLLGLTSLISMLSKGLSRVFSSTTVQKHQLFGTQLLYEPTLTSVHDYWKNHSFDYMELLSAKWYLCFLICCLGLL